jgi:hypothetical protein
VSGVSRLEETAWNWRRDGAALGLLWILCLGMRVWTLPATFWEWDEINFARAIHRFDLLAHRPHPPGFPVFILLLRAAFAVIGSDHGALLAINLLFGSLLGGALYLVFREVLGGRGASFGGAILGASLPPMWLPSLMARSDLPAMVTGLLVVGLLLRGRRSPWAYLVGSGLLGIGMGIRVTIAPLAVGVLIWVFFVWLRRGHWRLTASAIGVALAGYLSWYLPVLFQTGWEAHRALTRNHSQHLIVHDSLWSSYWTLEERLTSTFVTVWGSSSVRWAILGTSGLGILLLLWRRKGGILGWLSLLFLPYLLFTFSLNSPMGMVFYILPALPLFAGLAAVGLTELVPRREGRAVALGGTVVGGAGILWLVLLMGGWMEPVVSMLRHHASPTARAMQELMSRLDPVRDKVSHDHLLLPHVRYWLEEAHTEEWIATEAPGLNLIDPDNRPTGRHYLLSTQPALGLPYQIFRWPSGLGNDRLRPLSLGRYFELYLTESTPVRNHARIEGWYPRESNAQGSWQWMSKRGSLALFHEGPRMRLRLRGRLYAGSGGGATPPELTVRLNDRELGRWAGPQITAELVIPAPTSGALWSILDLEASESFIPKQNNGGTDNRELGFQSTEISWERAADAEARVFGEDHFLGEGWHQLNLGKPRSWRRGGPRSIVHLPALPAAYDGELRLVLHLPGGEGRQRTEIALLVGGVALGSLRQPLEAVETHRIFVPRALHQGQPLELEIRSNTQLPLPEGGGSYGFRLTSLGWLPGSQSGLAPHR